MRALIVAEGKHERSGALEALVRKVSSKTIECDHDRISRRDIHAHHGKGRGCFKRAVRWLIEANKRGYDALILLVDEDGHSERIREISDAQESTQGIELRALGVAIRKFDAWMLADEAALTRVLGVEVQRQQSPERIPDPKSVCAALRDESPGTISLTEMYATVASGLDVNTLSERCPLGFAPFAERVRQL